MRRCRNLAVTGLENLSLLLNTLMYAKSLFIVGLKGKVHHGTGHEGPQGEKRYNSGWATGLVWTGAENLAPPNRNSIQDETA